MVLKALLASLCEKLPALPELLSSEKIHVKVLCEVCVNIGFEDHVMWMKQHQLWIKAAYESVIDIC